MAQSTATPPPETSEDEEETADIPALLIPMSNSAIFSSKLRENQKRIASFSILTRFAASKALESGSKGQRVLKLEPEPETTSYLLGTSDSSYIILKTKSEHECYVNWHHCQLFPDPDEAVIVVSNVSTTIFTVQSLDEDREKVEIPPSCRMPIGQGNWFLTLGTGLRFIVVVLSRAPFICNGTLLNDRCPKDPATSSSDGGAGSSSIPKRTLKTPRNCDAREMNEFVRSHEDRHSYSVGKIEDVRVARRIKIEPPAVRESNTAVSSSGDKPGALSTRQRSKSSTGREINTPQIDHGNSGKQLVNQTIKTKVFKVERSGVVVAAKVLRNTRLESAAKTWQNEKSILAALKLYRNRHIANLADFDGIHLTLYLDYIAGRDLSMRRGESDFCELSEIERHIVWKNISSALGFIHGHDIVHHDVKPHNIIYDERGRKAVLCDFGLATKGPKLHYGGSPSYIAPDLLLRRERSHPSDIWAFGVTMLFVAGLIRLPKHNWNINDLKNHKSNAFFAMSTWHSDILRTCSRIPQNYSLLRCMLKHSRAERITASELTAGVSERAHLGALENVS